MSGPLLRAAAVAPVALKSGLYERVFAKLAREAHVPPDELIETNLGVRSGLRCRIPAFKHNYLFGRPDTSLAERASLRLAQTLAADCADFVDVGANEGIYTFLAHCAVTPRPRLHWFEPDAALFARVTANLAANATYMLRYDQQLTPTTASVNEVNVANFPLRFRGRATADWTHGWLTSGLALNYTGAYHDPVGVPMRIVSCSPTKEARVAAL